MTTTTRQLILIRGPICAGKSTLVAHLRPLLPTASIIDFDVIKVQLDHRGSSAWRREAALRVALAMASEVAHVGRPLIVDIPSYTMAVFEAYRHFAQAVGYKLTSLLLYPPLETCLARNRNRPILGAAYILTDLFIEQCWHRTILFDDEMVFDTSQYTSTSIAQMCIDQLFVSQ